MHTLFHLINHRLLSTMIEVVYLELQMNQELRMCNKKNIVAIFPLYRWNLSSFSFENEQYAL